MASKYEALANYLRYQDGPRHTISFAKMEDVIGTPFPPSSRKRSSAWWGNVRSPDNRRVQAKDGWLAAGWEVESVDLEGQSVTFRR